MASQPPVNTTSDAPFGLQPNVAAGLAYLLFMIVGGLIMLFGGGTNRFVKFAAAQAITLWVCMFVLNFVLSALHLGALVFFIVWPLETILWLVLVITAFMGKEVRVPGVADLTQKVFGAQLA